ncbi:hypothetical protein GJW58_12455 [Listeria monocytogenes]|nr:hypothetical protein [Listeria monocytogenes]EDN9846530.1 hypothetical protein [Listeria monocytogenes]
MSNIEENSKNRYWEDNELLNFIIELNEKSSYLFQEISKKGVTEVTLLELKLSEIHSIYWATKTFCSIRDIGHYQITTLFSFWENFYQELKSTSSELDSNTSWLASVFKEYDGQHEIVLNMLKDDMAGIKTYLPGKTTD